MKLKKILIIGLLLIIVFSNMSILASTTGNFYYKGSFSQDVSGTTGPTYNATSTSGVENEMIFLLQIFIYVIVGVVVLLVFLYFCLLRRRNSKKIEKTEDNVNKDKDDEVIQERN